MTAQDEEKSTCKATKAASENAQPSKSQQTEVSGIREEKASPKSGKDQPPHTGPLWERILKVAATPIAVALVGGLATYTSSWNAIESANAQISAAKEIAGAQRSSNEKMIAFQTTQAELQADRDRKIKTMDAFLSLVKGQPREREIAVRLLEGLDKDLAFNLALSIAMNRSEEDNDVRRAAFVVGKQMDSQTNSATFLTSILAGLHINLCDEKKDSNAVTARLNRPEDGYSALVEALYRVLGRRTLKGKAPSLEIINGENLKYHKSGPITDPDRINEKLLKDAVVFAWKNAQGKKESDPTPPFDSLVY